MWGAYFAAVGFNNVVPARGGDVIKLFLTRSSIPGSRYPTVAAAFFVESIFDACVGVLVLIFAFTQGVFPKPPDFSKLSSFDISYLAEHFRLTLFLITAARRSSALVAFALLSVRVKAFWARVRQGVTILSDRRRYLREVAALQVRGVAVPLHRLLVPARRLPRRRLGQERAARVRRQPGRGRRAVHARRRRRAAGAARQGVRRQRLTAVVAAYSVGQQIAIAAFTALDGPGRGRVHLPLPLLQGGDLHAGRASREAEREAEREGVLLVEDERRGRDPPAPRRAPRGARARRY